MNTPGTWQAWLEEFVRGSAPDRLVAHLRLNSDRDIGQAAWTTLFYVENLFMAGNAMLLACLQEPEAAAEQALAAIAAAARAVDFSKPPRGLKKSDKEAFRTAARDALPYSQVEAELLPSLFLRYLHDDYDAAADPNILMQEARFEVSRGRVSEALRSAALAGAALLRGQSLWVGWAGEGEGPFPYWGRALSSLERAWGPDGLLPLGPVSAERLRARERAEAMARMLAQWSQTVADDADDAAADDEQPPDQAFMQQFLDLANRATPLDAAEIQSLGDVYERLCAAAMRALEVLAIQRIAVPQDGLLEVAAAELGVLRCAHEHAIDLLVGIVRDDAELYEVEAIETAVWSLQQIGQAALPQVFDYVRYSENDGAREDMLEVLGVVGRGSPAVFDYVVGKFLGLSWQDDKPLFVRALALLHDARAVPMLCDALSDPALDEDAAYELMDGLEEMGVAFSVDDDTGNIDIPEYGVIEHAAPDDWIPRAEREELELDEPEAPDGAWQPNEDDAVVFDKFGIAHCVDCGAVMHQVNGEWRHPIDMDEFPPPRVAQVGRNDLCPCGSGKKYKFCHGRPDQTRVN